MSFLLWHSFFGAKMNKRYMFIFLMGASVLLSGCRKVNSNELSTQPREYVEPTTEFREEKSEVTESEDFYKSYVTKYPDVDFNQIIIPIKDEEYTSYLTLKSRYCENSEITYNEGGRYEEYPFHIIINNAHIITGKENLNDSFRCSDRLNDPDFINSYGEDTINNGKFIELNVSIKNLSKDSRKVYLNNKQVETVYGEIGIYNISEIIGEYITTDYLGDNRGKGKSKESIEFGGNEEINMNVLYFLEKDYKDNTLYFNVHDIYASGEYYDDGTWHADSEGAPNIIKIELEKDD